MKNYINRSFTLIATVCVALLAMHWLPDLEVKGHALRRVDLLSDIRPRVPETPEEELDTLPEMLVVKPMFVDTCREGLTCVEDYSDSTMRGMKAYYEALRRIESGGTVRVAVFGDSFIEADIFTADLRALLQQQYGGSGVGYVPVTSHVNGFRPTVRHSFAGWRQHSVNDTIGFKSASEGITNTYHLAKGKAFAELKTTGKYAPCLDSCQRASFFYLAKDSFELTAVVNGEEQLKQMCVPSTKLREAVVRGDIRNVKWEVAGSDSSLFYGMTMDNRQGVVVDNFSLRGSSGISIAGIPARFLRNFNEIRPYDLIILQFGLNVVTPKGVRYDNYLKGMKHTVEHLKRCFPQASILLMSVGDRDYKNDDGEIRTMPGVRNLVRYQQRIAAETGIAFWNLFEAMGGNESMLALVEATPAMANYDYTHINFKGGAHLAAILYETLEYGKEQYERHKAYEEEWGEW